jgi:hypothetical protein
VLIDQFYMELLPSSPLRTLLTKLSCLSVRNKIKPNKKHETNPQNDNLACLLSGLTTASQAQSVVWSQNFDSLALGSYGAHTTDFAGGATPINTIVAPGDGGSGQAMQLTFNATNGTTLNLQMATLQYAASGNTSANLADYTLSFDMAIQGVTPGFAFMEIGVFGTGSWIFNGDASSVSIPNANLPSAGSGYQHFSLPLSTFHADSAALNPTDSLLSVGFGVLAFPSSITAIPETILVDNVAITMVPEPSTFAMFAGGIGLFASWRRFRRAS